MNPGVSGGFAPFPVHFLQFLRCPPFAARLPQRLLLLPRCHSAPYPPQAFLASTLWCILSLSSTQPPSMAPQPSRLLQCIVLIFFCPPASFLWPLFSPRPNWITLLLSFLIGGLPRLKQTLVFPKTVDTMGIRPFEPGPSYPQSIT